MKPPSAIPTAAGQYFDHTGLHKSPFSIVAHQIGHTIKAGANLAHLHVASQPKRFGG
jgi:hypothetical protein